MKTVGIVAIAKIWKNRRWFAATFHRVKEFRFQIWNHNVKVWKNNSCISSVPKWLNETLQE